MKPIKISAQTVRALIDAGDRMRSAIERGDLSSRDKYIAAWRDASHAALHEITPKEAKK